MKKTIHPDFFATATTTCACGAKFDIGSTNEKTTVELCSKCHPFYTGQQKIVDSARRVEKFEARIEKKGTALNHKAKAAKKEERAKRKAEKKLKESEA